MNDETPPSKLKGRAKAAFNKKSYAAYVANLVATGKKFPINQLGTANVDAVASACGFERQVLYKTLKEQFEKDVQRIGTEIHEVSGKDKTDRLTEISEANKKNASALQKTLDAKEQELIELRQTNLALEQRINELESEQQESQDRFEDMLGSGRSFTL